MNEPQYQITVRRLIIGGLLALATLAAALQIVIDGSMQNIASACVVLASAMSILLYIGWSRALEIQPLSTFAIFGFCMTTQLGALLAQTAAWTPLRSSLYDPLNTFGTLAFYQAIAMATHAAYSFLFARKHSSASLARRALNRAGLYRTPPVSILWFMGAIGLASVAVSSHAGSLGKVGDAFNFLTWAPFLILLYMREAGDAYCDARRTLPLVLMYALLVCLLGIATNARGMMFLGMVTVGLMYLVEGLGSTAPARISRATLLKIGAVAAVGLALAGPMADLATAMAIARQHRGKVPPLELMAETFDAWRRPYLIAQYRAFEKVQVSTAYDETYIANPLVARFVETKFHDNCLHFASLLTSEDSKARLRAVTIATLWASLPSPILSALHITINKAELRFSIGDYVVYLSRGLPLGGYKTGSVFAQGITLLGPLFPFVYAAICLIKFMLMDLLTVRTFMGNASISALAKMQAWSLFIYGITADGLSGMVNFIVRDCFQMMLIYLLMFGLATMILPRRLAFGPDVGDATAQTARGRWGRKPHLARGR